MTLAIWDSAAGLIPCRIVAAWPSAFGGFDFLAELTGSRGIYRRGGIIESNALAIVPRYAIRRGRYSSRISAYTWQAADLAEALEAGKARWHLRSLRPGTIAAMESPLRYCLAERWPDSVRRWHWLAPEYAGRRQALRALAAKESGRII